MSNVQFIDSVNNKARDNDHRHTLLGPGGRIYILPNHDNIGVFDTNTRLYREIVIPHNDFPPHFWGGVIHSNGNLYMAPYYGLWIGVLDTVTESWSVINITSIFPWT